MVRPTTNDDLQRQIDQLRADNTREHEEVKLLLTPVAKLCTEHELALYGREGTTGIVGQVSSIQTDLNTTKFRAAAGLLLLLVGAVVGKITGMI